MTKFFCYLLTAGVCAASIALSTAQATPTTASDARFTPTQTKQIETLVHDYLLDNPGVIVEAIQGLQKKEEQKYADEIKAQIPKYTKDLFDPKAAGREMIGSDKPDAIIAYFYSYQCPNCRATSPIFDKLVNTQKNLQVIYIGWAFEGNDDIYAAKVVLAAQKQGKFYDLYKALMKEANILTQDSIEKAAKATGLDMDKLHTDMNDANVDKALRGNFKLAQDLKLLGAPTVIVTNNTFSKFSIIFGRTNENDLQKAIKEVH